ncbi:hypothetical protein HOLleu_00452 [Holothuria leucospilota]|uniref:Uncharacterized protein n=1 Tax=Holothuria leucospilota TaxID=206669 RepID=A0A9Q1HKC0_HOLLE|nr:hypothetical protein HOLleu_00452 [Holothuria leucospilota]
MNPLVAFRMPVIEDGLLKAAESQQTMLSVLYILHEKHQTGIRTAFLVVAGDCKTYDIIIHLKRLYEELDWVIPYLGEWHLLKNSQPALLKLYSDAGLKTLMSLFHKGATLKAVSSATGFKKTHYFLLQSWEAMYRTLVDVFIHNDSTVQDDLLLQLEREVEKSGSGIFPSFFDNPLADSLADVFDQFQKFVADKASMNCNFKFWSNFCLRDMIFYSGLYMAIRSRDFALRGACIRKMGPLFHALDRSNYLRVVPCD